MELKKVRETKGFTQVELASIAGISQNGLSAIETGKRNPSVSVAKRLAPFLGVNWWELYEDDEKEESNE